LLSNQEVRIPKHFNLFTFISQFLFLSLFLSLSLSSQSSKRVRQSIKLFKHSCKCKRLFFIYFLVFIFFNSFLWTKLNDGLSLIQSVLKLFVFLSVTQNKKHSSSKFVLTFVNNQHWIKQQQQQHQKLSDDIIILTTALVSTWY